jgi:hypothetical protein
MNLIRRRVENLEQTASVGEIRTLEDFWAEVARYADARERGESFSARPISEGLARALIQGLREAEKDLGQRLSQNEDEGFEAMRELRAALEREVTG